MTILCIIVTVCLVALAHARCRCFSEAVKNVAVNRAKCYTPPFAPKTQLYNFPPSPNNVKYAITFIVDDILDIYIDGQLVVNDNIFPKKRYTLQYEGPCKDIIAHITNFSPRGVLGGAGLSFLIDYNGVRYGSAVQTGFSTCASPICSDPSAENVLPVFASGLTNPPMDCFTNPDKCDWTKWGKTTIHDILVDYPLCEFVDMARLGGMPVNPIDGQFVNNVTFGLRFNLPFCH